MRRRPGSAVAADYDDLYDSDAEPARGRRKDVIAVVLAAVAVCAILVNVLFLQKGPHPAPIFRAQPVATHPAPAPVAKPVRTVGTEFTGQASMPRPRPTELQTAKMEPVVSKTDVSSARSRLELTAEIQKELAKRGFYDGAADGVYGPKTDAAIRDFAQAAGTKHGGEVTEQLLQTIVQSGAKAKPVTTASAPRHDPIAELIAPSPQKQIQAVQRALSDYGYGQIKPNGTLDAATQDAISRFERARKMPVTGQMSPRLLRELSVLTGRPLD